MKNNEMTTKMNYIWLDMYIKNHTGYSIPKENIVEVAKEILFYTDYFGINTETEVQIRKCIKNIEG